jgi:small subunit ribosomal protein S9
MPKKSKNKYIYAVGRRKQATATIRLFSGKGKLEVNGKSIADYFPGEVNAYFYTLPFELTDTRGKYHGTFLVRGGGKKSQLEAVRLALSRALEKIDREKYRSTLKKAGLLTVDDRIKERSKPGQAGRARAKKQSPKR